MRPPLDRRLPGCDLHDTYVLVPSPCHPSRDGTDVILLMQFLFLLQ